MKRIILLLLAVGVVFQSCKRTFKYESSSFDERTRDHRIIAVLPVEMVFTGKQPKNLTADQIKKIEEAESKSFQESLYSKILSKNLRVEVQSVNKTNSLLASNGIDIRKSWSMTAEELARILKVDAVVKAKVEKERYMSDLASAGIQLAESIIGIIPGVRSNTNLVKGSCEVLDADDDASLWRIAADADADWSRPANEVIEALNRKFARNFPYRR